jgi:hypothetical protein
MHYINKIFLWVFILFHSWIIRISIALRNTEESILKADPNDLAEKNKHNIRMRHRNRIAEKMLQGQRDEKFVQDYYELLKKADKFLRESTPLQIEMAADKWGLNYGKTDEQMKNVSRVAKRVQRDENGNIIKTEKKPESEKKTRKDQFGRRYEHYGFFDPKNKNYGKTLAQVLKEEIGQRLTKDDLYPVEFMFSNKPITDGIAKNNEIVETKTNKSLTGFEAVNELEKALKRRFPLRIIRENDEVVNKLERLTEYLHIKKITSELRLLEFFIPSMYKSFEVSENSDIFAELTSINQVWISDEYGTMYGYKINDYYKRSLIYSDKNSDFLLYDVIKFKAEIINKIN